MSAGVHGLRDIICDTEAVLSHTGFCPVHLATRLLDSEAYVKVMHMYSGSMLLMPDDETCILCR